LPLLQDYVDDGFVEIHDATKWDDRSFIFATDYSVKQGSMSTSILEHLTYDKQQKMQIDMWRRYHDDRNSSRHIWIAQLDVDEYYNPKERGKGGSHGIKTVLRSARMKGAKSVRAAKVEFGPSGNLYPQPTIRDSYLIREKIYERHTGFALAWAITGMAPGCPHVYITNSFLADVTRGSHECNNWFGDKYGGEVRYEVYYSPPTELSVHHYNTKSILECYQRSEIPHPDGKVVGRHCLGYKYKVCDDSILRFLEEDDDGHHDDHDDDGWHYSSYSSHNGAKMEKRNQKSPCENNNGSSILDQANQMRTDILSRKRYLDVLDICTKKSVSVEEEIACGIKRPGPNYKSYVPKFSRHPFHGEGGEMEAR